MPGDKSISHRAAIVAACSGGVVEIVGVNPGRDVRATLAALEALGVRIERSGDDIAVHSKPLHTTAATLDCMNSGSTARMLLGACAGAGIAARFDGDASLRARPMEPVAAQLRAFGARIETTHGRLPATFFGTAPVGTRHFILIEPSAQVKSALLFAAAFAGVGVTIAGDRGSRDHTERLLRFFGATVQWDERRVTFSPAPFKPQAVAIPGDFSAAAFFITAAAIAPGSAIVVRDVGVNPTRTGLLDALLQMGAGIEVRDRREVCGEPVADIAVEHAPLQALAIGPDLALRAIDEIPLLAVAAAFARGQTRIADVGRLRAKESDRVAAIERLLSAAGIATDLQRNALTIAGGAPRPPTAPIETHGDHRVVMAAAVLAAGAGPVSVDDARSEDVSFPGFGSALERLRAFR